MLVKINVVKPEGATVEDVAEFIADVLTWAGGCRRPDDPMFHSLTLTRLIVHGREFGLTELTCEPPVGSP